MSRTSADAILQTYADSRDLRDRVLSARNGCLCSRHESVEVVDGVAQPQIGEPCWKAARKWESLGDPNRPEGMRFYFDPPTAEWCVNCRQRQEFTEQLRAAVKAHAAAKRAILQRGRALSRAALTRDGGQPATQGSGGEDPRPAVKRGDARGPFTVRPALSYRIEERSRFRPNRAVLRVRKSARGAP